MAVQRQNSTRHVDVGLVVPTVEHRLSQPFVRVVFNEVVQKPTLGHGGWFDVGRFLRCGVDDRLQFVVLVGKEKVGSKYFWSGKSLWVVWLPMSNR